MNSVSHLLFSSVMQHYQKEDLLLPSKKGISLTLDQYQQLRKHVMDGSLDVCIEYAKDEVERDENEMNNKNEVNMGHVKDYRYGKEEYKEDNGVGSLYRKLPEENEV